MPRRTRGWIQGGRVVAILAVTGMGVYLWVAGLDRAAEIAGPVSAVVALAALFAPFLLPTFHPPSETGNSDRTASHAPAPNGVVLIADHGSVAAQQIGEVTINPRWPDPEQKGSQAES